MKRLHDNERASLTLLMLLSLTTVVTASTLASRINDEAASASTSTVTSVANAATPEATAPAAPVIHSCFGSSCSSSRNGSGGGGVVMSEISMEVSVQSGQCEGDDCTQLQYLFRAQKHTRSSPQPDAVETQQTQRPPLRPTEAALRSRLLPFLRTIHQLPAPALTNGAPDSIVHDDDAVMQQYQYVFGVDAAAAFTSASSASASASSTSTALSLLHQHVVVAADESVAAGSNDDDDDNGVVSLVVGYSMSCGWHVLYHGSSNSGMNAIIILRNLTPRTPTQHQCQLHAASITDTDVSSSATSSTTTTTTVYLPIASTPSLVSIHHLVPLSLPSTDDPLSYLLSSSFWTWMYLPSSSFVVNLNPSQPSRVIDLTLARTAVGAILLEADLSLKQQTAALLHPDTETGHKFWSELNAPFPTPTLCLAFRSWIISAHVRLYDIDDVLYLAEVALDVEEESRLSESGRIAMDSIKGVLQGCEASDPLLQAKGERLFREIVTHICSYKTCMHACTLNHN
jgi:hypothetical protein